MCKNIQHKLIVQLQIGVETSLFSKSEHFKWIKIKISQWTWVIVMHE